jgi:hypothetical protein
MREVDLSRLHYVHYKIDVARLAFVGSPRLHDLTKGGKYPSGFPQESHWKRRNHLRQRVFNPLGAFNDSNHPIAGMPILGEPARDSSAVVKQCCPGACREGGTADALESMPYITEQPPRMVVYSSSLVDYWSVQKCKKRRAPQAHSSPGRSLSSPPRTALRQHRYSNSKVANGDAVLGSGRNRVRASNKTLPQPKAASAAP